VPVAHSNHIEELLVRPIRCRKTSYSICFTECQQRWTFPGFSDPSDYAFDSGWGANKVSLVQQVDELTPILVQTEKGVNVQLNDFRH